MKQPTEKHLAQLEKERNIWLATVRPDGRPHLIPIWFVWFEGVFYICTGSDSVKTRNITQNPLVALSLEDGTHPLVCEGQAQLLDPPWPEEVAKLFKQKYDWNIHTDKEYDFLFKVIPKKWLLW